MINKVFLIGRLGKDPEVHTITSGDKVAKFSLATTERWKGKDGEKKESTQWHNVVVWKHLAELAEKYLNKGSLLYLEGRIEYSTFEHEGQTKYKTEIIGSSFTFLDKKNEGTNEGTNEGASEEEKPKDDLPF